MYGFPKIYEENIHFRPILSLVNSAQHKKAKCLNSSLQLVLKYFSAHCLKDSFTFVDKIKDIEVQNTFIASFYIKNIYTNVSLKEVIEVCVDTLYKISQPTIFKMN